ncbi:unnamed protein product [Kuraishia capsulata CBS 1993]|uniref:Uncharacterized protein n=1 Tax=Kuraishia capsulata CBS 1993 TaxID=1382522 RepID=W6MFK6_9ASCO|nr:uncharacterized protein KUCA_T00000348001 [Kuraishia capsulata CBS 1993]CDK24386.1 unnamed protein product [Kuraishia capsulata CBS 1993]
MFWKVVITGFLGVLLWLYFVPLYADIDPLALDEQASVSATRPSPRESAVYRSVDVPHGLPLTTGLRLLRHGSRYTTTDGNLQDCWDLHKEAGKAVIVGGEKIARGELAERVESLVSGLKMLTSFHWLGVFDCELDVCSLSVQLAGLFTGDFGLFQISDPAGLTQYAASQESEKRDVDLVFVRGKDTKNLLSLLDLGIFATVVVLDDFIDEDIANAFPVKFVKLSELSELTAGKKTAYTAPDLTSSKTYFKQCLRIQKDDRVFEFTHGNFVSIVASQLYSLPAGHSWKPEDKVLIVVDHAEFGHYLAKLAMCFVVGCETAIVTSAGIDLDTQIRRLAPSIVHASDAVWSSNSTVPIAFYDVILNNVAESWFSTGSCTQLADWRRQFKQLRLVYSAGTPGSERLNHNAVQAKYGVRLIQELVVPGILGPVLKTNFYDYRVVGTNVHRRGVPANCLEVKVIDHGRRLADKREGKLHVRGFNIGKSISGVSETVSSPADSGEPGWMPLDVVGKFGTDGCFYEYV